MPICSACQHENDERAVLCRHCGRALNTIIHILSTKRLASDAPSAELIRFAPSAQMTSPISAVKLLVSGHEQAIVLDDNRENAVLGRTSGIGEAPAVDLSDYGAYMQGVSRHHASIRVNANACTIQDLGSANGTWVNQQRLPAYQPYPLKTGDEITLGKLRLVVDIQLVS